MNTEKQIKSKIYQYTTENVYSDPTKIEFGTLLFQEGYFDSMGFISLITFIENEFGLTTDDTDFVEENFESVNAITNYVIRKLALKTQPKPV